MNARRKQGGQRVEGGAGFTLIELLIVIVILGILALIIVPQISVSTDEAKLSTLKANLGALRSATEVYYAQHTNLYPAVALPATKPADVTTIPLAFVAQLTRFTDESGNISNTKDATYKFGPYIKGTALPKNPFNNKSDVAVDTTETDITVKSSTGANTGWKFYARTGVLIAADGTHDTE